MSLFTNTYLPDTGGRSASPLGRLGWFFLFLAVGLLAAFMTVAIVATAFGALTPGHAMDNPVKLEQALSTVTIFLLPAFLYAKYIYRERPFRRLGFRKAPKSIVFIIIAVALLLLSFPFDGWLGQLNRGIHLPGWMMSREKDADREIVALLKTGSFAGVLVNVFIIAALPAICEEACFRGALQPILIRLFKSPWAGIIVTGMFFSAFHLQFQGFLPRMALGILLGAIYWYSGSLWISIIAHFFTNAVQVVAVSYYPKYITEDPSVPLFPALVSLAITIALLLLLRRNSDQTYADAYAGENT